MCKNTQTADNRENRVEKSALDHDRIKESKSKKSPSLPLRVIIVQAIRPMLAALLLRERVFLAFILAWGLIIPVGAIFQRDLLDAAAILARHVYGNVISVADFSSFIKSGQFWHSLSSLLLPLLFLLLIQAGSTIRDALEDKKGRILWRKVGRWCEDRLLEKSSSMEYRYFHDQETINRLVRANNEFANRMQKVAEGIFKVLAGSLAALSASIVLVSVDWRVPFILIVASLPSVFLYRLQTEEAYRSAVDATGSTRRVWFFLTILTRREAMKEIRFWGLHDYLVSRHDEHADEVAAIRARACRRYLACTVLGDVLRYTGFAFVLFLAVADILNARYGIGFLALVLSGGGALQTAFTKATNALADIQDSGRYFQDWIHVMSVDSENCTPPAAYSKKLNSGTTTHKNETDIVCSNLVFTYPGAEKPTLNIDSLIIKQGEKVSVVGENGSGKSTFIALLCGLYAPDSGSIKVGAYEVSQNRDFVRYTISAALQENQRYDLSVAENIAIGNPYRTVSRSEIETVAHTMGVHSVIERLSRKYDTPLGLMDSGGVQLSGGEWQKIVIGRTLVKPEARIMILDEPTAALDPPSEAALYRSYADITGDRTSILVSHRLGSCKLADRILVFKDGSIIEEGSHRELIDRCGEYYQMFTAQADWYRD